jgi:hypothetical protein
VCVCVCVCVSGCDQVTRLILITLYTYSG